MPFKSKAQRRFLYAVHPKIAKRFKKHTTKAQERALPEKKKRKTRRKKKR